MPGELCGFVRRFGERSVIAHRSISERSWSINGDLGRNDGWSPGGYVFAKSSDEPLSVVLVAAEGSVQPLKVDSVDVYDNRALESFKGLEKLTKTLKGA